MRRLLAYLTLLALLSPALHAQPLIEAQDRFVSLQARKGLVLAGEPEAAKAGLEVLKQGGNAVDAAVATALALAVTLPRAGNLGGGGFMLIRTPQGRVEALDFREEAPGGARPDMYLRPDGTVDRARATVGALAVGVPGTVAGLEAALSRYGTIALSEAAAPAYLLASEGIVVSPWLHDGLTRAADRMALFPSSARVFLPGGKAPEVGTVLKQPDLAWSLGQLKKHGAEAFYRGAIADRLVAAIQAAGGLITLEDLANYRARWREPVFGNFGAYTVYSMPPPSSGGVHLIQMLNILDGGERDVTLHNSAAVLHQMAEAMRSAYADRSRWLGDPDFFPVPVEWLTSRAYADRIRASIPGDRARSSSQIQPGTPPAYESPDTTHLSVVDDRGWAVSLTYTLNFSYGSMLVAEGTGILLNNEMDDFSAAPGKPNAYGLIGGEANSIEPGKRPLSSMTPTVVQRDGDLVAVLGAPGGSRIITAVLQVLLNALNWDFNGQTSVSLPRIHHQWYPDVLYHEQGVSWDTLEKLRSMGHTTEMVNAVGHVLLILVEENGLLEAGADPRRPAAAEGF